MNPALITATAPRRLDPRCALRDQVRDRRVPAGEVDARCLANDAPPTIATDEVHRAERAAVGERDVDAGVVLRERGHFALAIERDLQLADPLREEALDALLRQREAIV